MERKFVGQALGLATRVTASTVVLGFATCVAQAAMIADYRADSGVTVDGSQNVVGWADQSGSGNDATPPSAGPLLTTATVNGVSRPVLRFDGSTQYLTAAPHVPSVGTLFLVFSNVDTSSGDVRRLVDWANSNGSSGLSVVTRWFGSNSVIVARNSGDDADIWYSPAAGDMEVDAVSWGAAGVTLKRRLTDGTILSYAANTNITSISDSGYTLHIGSGAPSAGDFFMGDLAELQVFNTQLDSATQTATMNALYGTWIAVPEPTTLGLLALGGIGILVRRRGLRK